MPIETEIFQVDSFTGEPYRGNPAGVCLLDRAATDSWMQHVAAEMNVSETAFITGRGTVFDIRYFTPQVEVPICGHATLAGAHILWQQGLVGEDQSIVFQAKAGVVKAGREGQWLCLDYPAISVTPGDLPEGIEKAIGFQPKSACEIAHGGYLLELESDEAVRSLGPDFALLRRGKFGGIIVTAESAADAVDFVSRYFAPDVGIDEDPVTGVAHCSLGPYWSQRLGKTELVGYQASARGGTVKVRVKGERVDILGQAVTVIRGRLLK